MSQFKRLYFDLETSPNEVYTWRTGYNLTIQPENIIRERAIICVAWKWEGGTYSHSLQWGDDWDDEELLREFIEVANRADELVAHNGDRFDVKWLRTRCLYHGIPTFPKYHSVDTLKLARKYFNFNSNKLDYIAKFLGFEGKLRHDGFSLWKAVCAGDQKALDHMVAYCKQDIVTLEEVYMAFKAHTDPSTHIGVHLGGPRWSCPHCGSESVWRQKKRVSAAGIARYVFRCRDCECYYTVGAKVASEAPRSNRGGSNQYAKRVDS